MDFELTEEQRMLKQQIMRFARKEIVPRVQEHERAEKFDHQSWLKLGEMGILALHFPEEYGGSGASVVTCCVAGEALGAAGVDGGLTL